MLLTLAKPAKAEFEYKTHEYSPSFYSSTSARYSPNINGRSATSQSTTGSTSMAADHRGLPPPSAMTLPNPSRVQSSMGTSFGSLPPAPPQWQGAEDGMKNWLMAKSEEEKRKQEEEKTKQEGLRLDQRRVEQEILRESMHGGIPPHLIPMIFAGIGGASLANMSAEWIQQYSAQLQATQQQQQHAQAQAAQQALPQSLPSPESRRMAQVQPGVYAPVVYGGTPQTPQTGIPSASAVVPGQHLQGQPPHTFTPPGRTGVPTSAPRSFPPTSQSQLPRLNTTEMHIQAPVTATSVNQQAQQSQPSQQEQTSSPIYFHHWVPPSTQQEKSSSGNQPATPSSKYKASSSSQHERPHASDPDYTSSPKKRKLGASGAQEGAVAPTPPTWVPPTTIYSYTSPSYSTSSTSTPRRGHGRNRSDASTRGAEGPRATLSRRSTLRDQDLAEGRTHHGDIPESSYTQPSHGAEGHYQNPYRQHQEQQAPAPLLQRNDGPGDGPQARIPSPRVAQGGTRQPGPQHQSGGPDLGPVPPSPQRDVRGHQN